MDHEASAWDLMEHILLDENEDPTSFPIWLLESITANFSNDHKIGSGGFADVYKGLLKNGIVAVKKLRQSEMVDMHETKFIQEVDSLMKVKHKNIVRFLGYCSDTQGKMLKHKGKNIMVEERQRFLCFEFLPEGSLDKRISDASSGLEWMIRYHIIKGICEGLHYLHEKKIVHSDLKPANILLDYKMVPKIGDFGLARSFDTKQTRAITGHVLGSLGYMAPEYLHGEITFKTDIYSLGVIILEILTGQKTGPSIENVLENWSNRFKTSDGGAPWLEHIRVCAEIGLDCVDSDPTRRPMTGHIIERLAELEHTGIIEIDLAVAQLLKDKSIKEGSNSSSNISGPSMDCYPQSHSVTQQFQGTVYNRKLYMHLIIDGPYYNQVNIADLGQPQMFGCTNVHDYPIYDSLDPNAKIVARAQGLHTETCLDYDNWFHLSRLVFNDGRFEGSTFLVIGDENKITGEWAIVGGTGLFAFAQGTITISRVEDSGSSNIKEICIRALGITGQDSPIETKFFKDNMINVDSNATTANASSPSMASPQSGPLTPKSQATEYIRTWYMHQIITGPDYNQVTIANPEQPEMFGYTNVHDFPIYDSLGPGKKIVAHAQGLHSKTSMMKGGSWLHWSKVVFDCERFLGSSFIAIGDQEGEWAIVGGTGEFAFVQGTVTTRRVRENWPSNIKEIHIHALCYPPTTPVETNNKIFEDGMTIVSSSAISNVSSPMANTNPQSAPVTSQSMRKYNRVLYMHQIISGPDYNQVNIANPKQPKMFGYTNVHDYPIYDSLGPGKKLIARAQGLHSETSKSYNGCFHWSSVVFTDERFQGSSLKTIGNQEGDWAIVGGTGAFTFAQGTVTMGRIQKDAWFSNIKEIHIDALCCTPISGVIT